MQHGGWSGGCRRVGGHSLRHASFLNQRAGAQQHQNQQEGSAQRHALENTTGPCTNNVRAAKRGGVLHARLGEIALRNRLEREMTAQPRPASFHMAGGRKYCDCKRTRVGRSGKLAQRTDCRHYSNNSGYLQAMIATTSIWRGALAFSALGALAMSALSAQEVPPPAPVATSVALVTEDNQPDLVLDEVIVRGKKLAQTITDAEDDFYKLYNKLNKDDKYDVNCAQLNTNPDANSRITSRVCLPGFVADAIVDYTVFKSRCQPPLDGFDEFDCLDRNKDSRLSWQEASARPDLDARMFTLDADSNGYLTRDEYPQEGSGPPAYQPPPPDLVLMEGSRKWYDHMMETIRSHPELQEKAGKLDGLWAEMHENRRLNSRLSADLEAERPPRKNRGRPPR